MVKRPFLLALGVLVGALSTVPSSPVSATSRISWPDTWAVLSTPHVPAAAGLSQVSCASSKLCIAIGAQSASSGASSRPLVEIYGGRTWVIAHPPGASASGALNAVSCNTKSWCMLVGEAASTATTALVDVYSSGHWASAPVPVGSELQTVSCPAVNRCIAFGSGGTPETPAAFSYRSGRWTKVPILGGVKSLGEVSVLSLWCVAVNSCLGVGFSNAGGYVSTRSVAVRYNGNSFEDADSPAWSAGGVSILSQVACESSTLCVTTGESQAGTYQGVAGTKLDSVVQVLHAGQWHSALNAPDSGTAGVGLVGGGCVATSCFVLGQSTADSGAIVEDRLEGGTWTTTTGLLSLPGTASLDSLACPNESFCMAVGTSSLNGGPTAQPVAIQGS